MKGIIPGYPNISPESFFKWGSIIYTGINSRNLFPWNVTRSRQTTVNYVSITQSNITGHFYVSSGETTNMIWLSKSVWVNVYLEGILLANWNRHFKLWNIYYQAKLDGRKWKYNICGNLVAISSFYFCYITLSYHIYGNPCETSNFFKIALLTHGQ